MSERPLVGITMGDPASIGPEIVVKALANPKIYAACRPLVIGDSAILGRALATTGVQLTLHPVAEPADGRYAQGTLDLIDLKNVDVESLHWGRVQAQAGRASFEYIDHSITLASAGRIDAVATAPINKEAIRAAGVSFIGHTEMYGEKTGTRDPLTMFEVKGLRIFFLTRHLSLAQAIAQITVERTVDYLVRCKAALERLGVANPRLVIAGLNPHAGEHGLFGTEEMEVLEPAAEQARGLGVQVAGVLPADSVFWHAAQGRFDAVLSLYHDQGHIAAKMYDFERTVSLTIGMKFLRTSVDHGTAFDIAGKGIASAVSMEEAIFTAARYASAYRS